MSTSCSLTRKKARQEEGEEGGGRRAGFRALPTSLLFRDIHYALAWAPRLTCAWQPHRTSSGRVDGASASGAPGRLLLATLAPALHAAPVFSFACACKRAGWREDQHARTEKRRRHTGRGGTDGGRGTRLTPYSRVHFSAAGPRACLPSFRCRCRYLHGHGRDLIGVAEALHGRPLTS